MQIELFLTQAAELVVDIRSLSEVLHPEDVDIKVQLAAAEANIKVVQHLLRSKINSQ